MIREKSRYLENQGTDAEVNILKQQRRQTFNHLLWPRFRAMKWYRFVSMPKQVSEARVSFVFNRSGRLCFLYLIFFIASSTSHVYISFLSPITTSEGLDFAVLRHINFWRLR